MNTPINLEELKTAWRIAKEAEDAANAERLAVETAILALMPSKLEGSVTEAGVTVTYKVLRKVDQVKLQDAWASLPPAVQHAFAWKPTIDMHHFRALEGYDLTQAQQFFTTQPAKPALSIKP